MMLPSTTQGSSSLLRRSRTFLSQTSNASWRSTSQARSSARKLHCLTRELCAYAEAEKFFGLFQEVAVAASNFEQRAADISVIHPAVVENYRAAHGIYLTQQNGQIGTEAQREAFVHYRALFEKLLGTEQETPKEARA